MELYFISVFERSYNSARLVLCFELTSMSVRMRVHAHTPANTYFIECILARALSSAQSSDLWIAAYLKMSVNNGFSRNKTAKDEM